jgi:long-chain acyl-CoA synthetase
MNLAELMTDTAAEHGDETALKLDDVEVSYSMLDQGSAAVAGLLKSKGFEVGDRVGIMLPNVPYFALIYYGVLRAGGIVVPMNPLLKGREVAYYLKDPGAKIMFGWKDFAEEAKTGSEKEGAELIVVEPGEFEKLLGDAEADDTVVDRNESDTAVILYTSGTTGQPKGAELTHKNLTTNANTARSLFDISTDDVCLGALPLFHSFGQTCGLNASMASGACLSMIPRFDPAKALEIIQRDKVTVFEGVPTMFTAMLHCDTKDDYDVSSLKVCASGGSAMPGEVMRGFEEAFKCTVLEGYGLSETSPVASFNQPEKGSKEGSIGMPVRGVEMRIVDEDHKEVEQGEVGEIAIRGENVMKGYWERPEATEESVDADGWFYSGDMGKIDEDGFYFIVDRKKEMIIRGGFNIYPREIEEVIYEHPAVREAAVIGIPHDSHGEEVAAVVSLKEGESVSEDELRDFVKKEVAAYKYPRKIYFVDELPKGPTGKIMKREIDVEELESKVAS